MKSTTEIAVVKSIAEMRDWQKHIKAQAAGEQKPAIGFVPTMGALHEGHLSLIRRAVKECRHVVVSIFVNPMQFGPQEDFDKYPRPFEKDLELCRQAGAEVIFHPSAQEFYKNGRDSSTKVIPPEELTNRLCGLSRSGHFTGVATVVLKLFSAVLPDKAYFGEKDYQQLCVIKRMVDDLNLPVAVEPVPTIREADGLAMSSRNVYLTADERRRAPELYRTLCTVREEVTAGRASLSDALKMGRERLSRIPEFSLQYLEACDAESLEVLKEAKQPMVILIAAKLGNVRLIDNLVVRS